MNRKVEIVRKKLDSNDRLAVENQKFMRCDIWKTSTTAIQKK